MYENLLHPYVLRKWNLYKNQKTNQLHNIDTL